MGTVLINWMRKCRKTRYADKERAVTFNTQHKYTDSSDSLGVSGAAFHLRTL